MIGFKLGSMRRLGTPEERGRVAIGRWLAEARSAWREALRFDDDNYRALGTACWVIFERLELGGVDPVEESELFAEWGDIVDRYLDIEVPPSQLDQQDRAESTFAARIGDTSRFQSVMQRAEARGSNAVHVLVARDLRTREGAAGARRYLDEHCDKVLLTDRAVLLLYMRVWWESETRLDSYLGHERACLGLTGASGRRSRSLPWPGCAWKAKRTTP